MGRPSSLPVANAGLNSDVLVKTTVSLDGNGSTNPQGRRLKYTWVIISRPLASQASIIDPSTSVARLFPDVEGTYMIRVEVSNGYLSSTALVELHAKPNPLGGPAPNQVTPQVVGNEVVITGNWRLRFESGDDDDFVMAVGLNPRDEIQEDLDRQVLFGAGVQGSLYLWEESSRFPPPSRIEIRAINADSFLIDLYEDGDLETTLRLESLAMTLELTTSEGQPCKGTVEHRTRETRQFEWRPGTPQS